MAEQGDPAVQNNLAQMYLAGNGVAQDFTEAARWLLAAAEKQSF
jgi:TPR repeat protein